MVDLLWPFLPTVLILRISPPRPPPNRFPFRPCIPWSPSRGQLGQSGDDQLRVHTSRSPPAGVGRRRRAAGADSSREGGGQPSLAGVLARRQGSALCCWSDQH